jgi:hypothetical protein
LGAVALAVLPGALAPQPAATAATVAAAANTPATRFLLFTFWSPHDVDVNDF